MGSWGENDPGGLLNDAFRSRVVAEREELLCRYAVAACGEASTDDGRLLSWAFIVAGDFCLGPRYVTDAAWFHDTLSSRVVAKCEMSLSVAYICKSRSSKRQGESGSFGFMCDGLLPV